MKTKPKILVVYPDDIELFAYYFRVLKNFQVDIVSTGKVGVIASRVGSVKTSYVTRNLIPEKHINHIPYPKNFKKKSFNYIFRFIYLILIIPKIMSNKYKLIVFHNPPFFLSLLSPVFRLLCIKTAVFVMDDWVEMFSITNPFLYKLGIGKILRFLEYFIILSTNKVFVLSKHLKNLYKPYNKNVQIVPLGVDIKIIKKIRPRRISKHLTIVFSGSLYKYKGVINLVKAFKIVRKNFPNLKLLIIGEGPIKEELKELARNEKNIIFTGALTYEKTISLLKGSDIAAIPFEKEKVNWTSISHKFFDYMACHLPIVYTYTGPHAYYIRKFKIGIEAEPNPESIAEKLTKLIKNEKLRKKLKNNCKKFESKIDFRYLLKNFDNEILI